MSLIAQIKELSNKFNDEVIAFRRHLHAHPELSYKEKETAAFISQELSKHGVDHQTDIAGHGIIGSVKGDLAGDAVYFIRGDIDALPIEEATGVDYASKNIGVMHACGHDVHAASVFGSILIFNALKSSFGGELKFIFQPAEEQLPGGASLMIKEGVLDVPNSKLIVGQHVFPELPAGKVGFRSGPYMASCDELYFTVRGKGGHGAMPHKVIDPVVIASQIVLGLQQVVSRGMDIMNPTVLSIGKVEANGATNIIPDLVKMAGTFRTMNEEWRAEAHQKIISIAEGIAKSSGGDCEVEIKKGYPCLVNNPEATDKCKLAAIEYLGEENVVDLPIRMTAEDFSYYSQYMPSTFYRLGVNNEAEGIVHPVHTAQFNIDEKALNTGMGLMAWLVLKMMNHEG